MVSKAYANVKIYPKRLPGPCSSRGHFLKEACQASTMPVQTFEYADDSVETVEEQVF